MKGTALGKLGTPPLSAKTAPIIARPASASAETLSFQPPERPCFGSYEYGSSNSKACFAPTPTKAVLLGAPDASLFDGGSFAVSSGCVVNSVSVRPCSNGWVATNVGTPTFAPIPQRKPSCSVRRTPRCLTAAASPFRVVGRQLGIRPACSETAWGYGDECRGANLRANSISASSALSGSVLAPRNRRSSSSRLISAAERDTETPISSSSNTDRVLTGPASPSERQYAKRQRNSWSLLP